MAGWAHAAAVVAVAASACAPLGSGAVDPAVAWRLPAVHAALGGGPRAGGRYAVLRFRVYGHDGRWTQDVVVGDGLYAERRERDDGARYAFGEDAAGPWVRVGDGPARADDGTWRREARTRAALLGGGFLAPRPGDEAAFLGHLGDAWEYAFRADGARTLTLTIDDATHHPRAWDAQDDYGRLVACEDVAWAPRAGRWLPARGTCATTNGRRRTVHTRFELADAADVTKAALPAWARREAPPEALPDDVVVAYPMDGETRIHLPARAPSGETIPLVLDSGAWRTTLDGATARALGVVPTGEPPIFLRPPWLPSGQCEPGVLDALDLDGAVVHGARVLVMERLGETGLLGADFLRRYVVDVDAPAGVVRLVPHGRADLAAALPLPLWTGRGEVAVDGEVRGVARGRIVLDTGMPDRVLVHATEMAAVHPRRRGSDVELRLFSEGGRSPDYESEVDGLRLGRFEFPAMPAFGRDRQRDRVGSGVALAGMGLMRHLRLAFDLRARTLWAWPGDSYVALRRAGVELEGTRAGARVGYVVPGSGAEAAGVREGDALTAVDGAAVPDVRDARRRLARTPRGRVRLRLQRQGYEREAVVALDPGDDRR